MSALLGDQINFALTSADILQTLQSRRAGKILPRHLTPKQERKLVREILAHIHEDGRWLGLAILLWCGCRPSEMRAIFFGDFRPFEDHPDRRYIVLYQTANGDGTLSDTMKNRFGPRAIPKHVELMYISRLREACVRARTHLEDISELPAICIGNDFHTRCTAAQVEGFAKKVLSSLFDPETLAD